MARIEALALSAPGEPLAFECRLATDNGWTLGHARIVVREYRRFLVLTQVAGEMVSPSEDVDEAWHLHITCTADYERFCRDAFGKFLHHQPAGGGSGESERHRRMYQRTLAHYQRAFGEEPPLAVWPAPGTRVEPPPPVGAEIRLPGPLRYGGFLALVILVGAHLLAWAFNSFGVLDASHALTGPEFLAGAVPLLAAIAWFAWRAMRPAAAASPRDVLDLYEAAWLAGGEGRVTAVAIGLLVDRGRLQLQTPENPGRVGGRKTRLAVASRASDDGLHPIELACLTALRSGTPGFDAAHVATRPWSAWMGGRLRAAGLVAIPSSMGVARAWSTLAATAWLVVALERLFNAMSTSRPVGILAILTLLDILLIGALTLRRDTATARGREALDRLGLPVRLQQFAARRAAGWRGVATPALDAEMLPCTLALLGPAAVLTDPRFNGLDVAIGAAGMRLASAAGYSSSGGASCGGGGGACGG